MKKYLTIIATILCALQLRAEVPPFQTKTFEFVHASPTNQVILYRIYTVSLPNLPGTTNFWGTTTSNRFTITNMLAEPVRVYVSSSNVWGEGNWSVPYEMPTRPAAPTELKPISSTIKTVVPGIIEISTDLVNYNERMSFTAVVNGEQTITYKHFPNEPALFYKTKGLPPSARPPALPQ